MMGARLLVALLLVTGLVAHPHQHHRLRQFLRTDSSHRHSRMGVPMSEIKNTLDEIETKGNDWLRDLLPLQNNEIRDRLAAWGVVRGANGGDAWGNANALTVRGVGDHYFNAAWTFDRQSGTMDLLAQVLGERTQSELLGWLFGLRPLVWNTLSKKLRTVTPQRTKAEFENPPGDCKECVKDDEKSFTSVGTWECVAIDVPAVKKRVATRPDCAKEIWSRGGTQGACEACFDANRFYLRPSGTWVCEDTLKIPGDTDASERADSKEACTARFPWSFDINAQVIGDLGTVMQTLNANIEWTWNRQEVKTWATKWFTLAFKFGLDQNVEYRLVNGAEHFANTARNNEVTPQVARESLAEVKREIEFEVDKKWRIKKAVDKFVIGIFKNGLRRTCKACHTENNDEDDNVFFTLDPNNRNWECQRLDDVPGDARKRVDSIVDCDTDFM